MPNNLRFIMRKFMYLYLNKITYLKENQRFVARAHYLYNSLVLFEHVDQ